jgi:hypothetical protein
MLALLYGIARVENRIEIVFKTFLSENHDIIGKVLQVLRAALSPCALRPHVCRTAPNLTPIEEENLPAVQH